MVRFSFFIVVIILIVIIIIVSFVISAYKKCPPGHVLIINNNKPDSFGNMNKIIFSGGAFVWPVVGSYQLFSLAPMAFSIDEEFLTTSHEKVKLDIKISIGISTSETVLKNAIDRFSGLGISQIKQVAQDIILGQLRKVTANTATNELEKLSDFSNQLSKEIEGELMEMGLKLIHLDIKSIQKI